MNELVERLVAELGIDRDVAEKAVGIILAFLIKEAPADKIKPRWTPCPARKQQPLRHRRAECSEALWVWVPS